MKNQEAVQANADRIDAAVGPKLVMLVRAAVELANNRRVMNGDKAEAIISIAEDISRTITPHTACRDKCSHCCHMATAISGFEAAMISRFTGRKMERPGRNGVEDVDGSLQAELVWKYTGVPCPFLVDEKCSVYAVRPVACRIHHNLDDTADVCRIVPGGQEVNQHRPSVPELDLRPFIVAHASIFLADDFGDIREFFP